MVLLKSCSVEKVSSWAKRPFLGLITEALLVAILTQTLTALVFINLGLTTFFQ